jgi:hypothetical protein
MEIPEIHEGTDADVVQPPWAIVLPFLSWQPLPAFSANVLVFPGVE